jgi:hypothetical protein
MDEQVLFNSWLRADDGRTLDEFVEDRKLELSNLLLAPIWS